MKYSDETISAIEAATMDFGSRFLLNEAVVREVLEALESTDEQKALREDAERWKHVLKLPFQSVWQLFCICPSPIERNKAVDQAIDKAREA